MTVVPRASVVIATHNRDEELAVCLKSLWRQTIPLEVIVMDDLPGKNTAEVVASSFPGASYYNNDAGRGPAFQRNEGIRKATCEIVFPFDDDVELINSRTIEASLSYFQNLKIGAIGIPFKNVRISEEIHQHPLSETQQIHSFVGAAHAVRRSSFLKVGGFRSHFFYMGEEGDLCIRMMDAGLEVVSAKVPEIHHFESPRRNSRRAAVCGRKNDILFSWHNVPQPYFFPHLVATTMNGIIFGLRSGSAPWHIRGLVNGYADLFRYWKARQPVSAKTYRKFRMLKKRSTRTIPRESGNVQ